MNTVIVVTRYGGYRHLADVSRQQDDGGFLTLCRGTSAWTLNSWRRNPDHPYLRPTQMDALPVCELCVKIAVPVEPQPVTGQSQAWLALITRRTVGGPEKAVGPFVSEEAAVDWLQSMQKPGIAVPLCPVRSL
jgi:hypothetical protein